jgi:hypothetical protein
VWHSFCVLLTCGFSWHIKYIKGFCFTIQRISFRGPLFGEHSCIQCGVWRLYELIFTSHLFLVLGCFLLVLRHAYAARGLCRWVTTLIIYCRDPPPPQHPAHLFPLFSLPAAILCTACCTRTVHFPFSRPRSLHKCLVIWRLCLKWKLIKCMRS